MFEDYVWPDRKEQTDIQALQVPIRPSKVGVEGRVGPPQEIIERLGGSGPFKGPKAL